MHSTLVAMLTSLARPTTIIASINRTIVNLNQTHASLTRSTRWPLGLLDDTRQSLNKDKESKLKMIEYEADLQKRELREGVEVGAMELAGWQEWRVREGKNDIKDLVRGMVILERERLKALMRALRKVRVSGEGTTATPELDAEDVSNLEDDQSSTPLPTTIEEEIPVKEQLSVGDEISSESCSHVDNSPKNEETSE